MVIEGSSGNVGIGTTGPPSRLTVSASQEHVQIRREGYETAGGPRSWSSIRTTRAPPPRVPEVHPSIRFHHNNRYWHRLEAQRDGFHFKDGDPAADWYSSIRANDVIANDLAVRDIRANDTRAHDVYATGHLFFEPRSNWGTEGGGPRKYWYFRRDNWNLNNLSPGGVSVHASGTDFPSDARLKEDVQEIPGALDRIGHLRGVHFAWNAEGLAHLARDIEACTTAGPDATPEENERLWQELRELRYARLSGRNIGLLAQDVEQVAPELVHTDAEGVKSVDYSRLTAVLVEAVKELDAKLAALEEKTDA